MAYLGGISTRRLVLPLDVGTGGGDEGIGIPGG
jgi:hypothetical protein